MLEARMNALNCGAVYEKVCTGKRLTLDEGQRLYSLEAPDGLHVLLALADLARRLRHGADTHWVFNRHINYTNVCVQRCSFCAYRRQEGEEGAFTLSKEDVFARLEQAGRVDEAHIVGGCHPSLPLAFYEDLLRSLQERFPDLVLKGFTMVEIAHFAALEGISTQEVLKRLQAAGLVMMPGGGAEIFAPIIRQQICPTKISGERWLQIAGEAHSLGLKSNASMLFGHMETTRHRLEHLDAIRRQQDASGGFVCFIPLPFLQQNNPLAEGLGGAPMAARGLDILRTVAIARLMLDNIPHVKAYWAMFGLKTALAALHCGADDIDGTIHEEHIGHMAGADSEQALTACELEKAIRGSGLRPVRRDGLFRHLPSEDTVARESYTVFSPPLRSLLQGAAEGRRLDMEEALALYQHAPLHELGAAAHTRRLAMRPPDVVTYVVDRNINYTNVCVCGCRFCAFYKTAGEKGGYVMEPDVLGQKIQETLDLGGRQILLQGGCHPELGLAFYEDMLRSIRERFPEVHVHAFSPPEIHHIAHLEGLSVAAVIARLREAGLHSIPGGGAEILCDAVRSKVSPGKCTAGEWLEVMRQAHMQGMRTTATMMFGHEETPRQRFEHLFALRELQEETGGFTAFIPWAFQPGNTAIDAPPAPPSEYLRMLALSRLVLDNLDNIQASWVTMGAHIAQAALHFGANDFGSTMIEENVVAAAGVRFRMDEAELRAIVQESGFTPCRRKMDYTLLEACHA